IDWEKWGFTVVGEVGTGTEAFEFIQRENPHLVITDIIMPGMDGIELLKRTREAGFATKFVMLTCMNELHYAIQAMEYGAASYILKLSMSVEDLRKTLSKISKELREQEQERKRQALEQIPASDDYLSWEEEKEFYQAFEHRNVERCRELIDGIWRKFRADRPPLPLVRHAFPVEPGLVIETGRIGTIWITAADGEPAVYLIGKDYHDAYEVMRTDLDRETLARLIGLGDYQSPYLVSSTGLLYPAESVRMFRYVYPAERISVESMENMLFPDPGITRNWVTVDGTEIYSDGKRGMEVDRDTQWMRFSDPMASIGQPFEPAADLSVAVQYVNRHGGWNGIFSLERVILREEPSAPRFTFRQWLPAYPEHYPILETPDARFGTIDVLMEGDVVTDYERSLYFIASGPAEREETLLPGGEALMERIGASGFILRMEAVMPAYRPRLSADQIEFVPVWAVQLNDGTLAELP
ncbi:MAG: hypothetical protein BAA02_03330, partial [Paenibacillaceae bacterium ZCTH02-B3]